jgi:hypothetical protein
VRASLVQISTVKDAASSHMRPQEPPWPQPRLGSASLLQESLDLCLAQLAGLPPRTADRPQQRTAASLAKAGTQPHPVVRGLATIPATYLPLILPEQELCLVQPSLVLPPLLRRRLPRTRTQDEALGLVLWCLWFCDYSATNFATHLPSVLPKQAFDLVLSLRCQPPLLQGVHRSHQ